MEFASWILQLLILSAIEYLELDKAEITFKRLIPLNLWEMI